MKINEMQLRSQAIKYKLCCSLYIEIKEDEKTSNLVMKVSFNHLRLAGLLVAGVGCCYSVLHLIILTLNDFMSRCDNCILHKKKQ